MGKLKRFSILAILLISGSFCFANQISFQIVQHDESLDCVSEDSMIIEDSVLNNFFEYGYIVTNSDAAISESKAQDEKLYKIGQGDAFNGFSDYFIQIRLYYERTEETLSAASDLYEIDFCGCQYIAWKHLVYTTCSTVTGIRYFFRIKDKRNLLFFL